MLISITRIFLILLLAMTAYVFLFLTGDGPLVNLILTKVIAAAAIFGLIRIVNRWRKTDRTVKALFPEMD